MNKVRRISQLLDIPAMLPSAVVAVIHFKLSILVGSYANEVFQRRFDTGERALGADAVIAAVDQFLAKPIPTVILARHPAYPLPLEWWIATAINSILWGAAIYTCYRLSSWLFKRYIVGA